MLVQSSLNARTYLVKECEGSMSFFVLQNDEWLTIYECEHIMSFSGLERMLEKFDAMSDMDLYVLWHKTYEKAT